LDAGCLLCSIPDWQKTACLKKEMNKIKIKKEIYTIPLETIENKIFLIRGKKVMLDSELAALYGVETKNLNKAVRRNAERFPGDFMFQLNAQEAGILRFQSGTLERGKYSKYLPYVFTEQGVAMLSSVLNSKRAVEVNVQIIRTFVKLREMVISNKELRIKIEEMERKYDKRFKIIFDTLREFLEKDKQVLKSDNVKIGFKEK